MLSLLEYVETSLSILFNIIESPSNIISQAVYALPPVTIFAQGRECGTAKNQDGTKAKVGFVTAVYVKRNMTAVSL